MRYVKCPYGDKCDVFDCTHQMPHKRNKFCEYQACNYIAHYTWDADMSCKPTRISMLDKVLGVYDHISKD